jgi:hypothetical protein
MNKLVVVGNGFDIYHGLDTRYISFGKFLKERYSNIYDNLLEFYGFSDIDDSDVDKLWAEFEYSLSLLDGDTVLENNSDYIAIPASEEFRDRDWGAMAVQIEMLVEDLTDNLFKAFKEFILQVKFPFDDELEVKKLKLNPNDLYLTFNYTNTLERYYKIPSQNISYIHGKAEESGSKLLLGHGIAPENFKEKQVEPPTGLSDDDLSEWEEHMADSYDHSYELGKDALFNYFTKSFKETSKIISDNQYFFYDLKGIKEILVLGHSLSEVDIPYFSKILNSTDNTAIWSVTYYGSNEKNRHKGTLKSLGVKDNSIRLIDMRTLIA